MGRGVFRVCALVCLVSECIQRCSNRHIVFWGKWESAERSTTCRSLRLCGVT